MHKSFALTLFMNRAAIGPIRVRAVHEGRAGDVCSPFIPVAMCGLLYGSQLMHDDGKNKRKRAGIKGHSVFIIGIGFKEKKKCSIT